MISVCMPTYKGLPFLKDSLDSVLAQSYSDFEVIICNDSSIDAREISRLVKSYKDKRLFLYQNKRNLGYAKNTKQTYDKSHGEYVFLLAQDDVLLSKDLFLELVTIFSKYNEIGAITRPYYWFSNNVKIPIRLIPKIKKRVLDVRKNPEDVIPIIESCGQLSGLCFKKTNVEVDFSPRVFTAHVQPFLSILRNSRCYYMSKFTVAIRTESSQTRFLSSIYNPSPAKTWVDMFNDLFGDAAFERVRSISIDHMCRNYVGLLQIKNYGHYKDLLAEIYTIVKYRYQNLLSWKFWIFTLVAVLVPRVILRKAVDIYKIQINRRRLAKIL